MKVIGKSQDGYILQATSEEVANLIGFYYMDGSVREKVKVGNEIAVNKMYKHLYFLQHHRKQIEDAIGSLNKSIRHLEEVNPVIDSIQIDE